MALIALLFFLKFSEQIVFKGYLVEIRFCNPSDRKTHMQCVIHVGCWELYPKHLHLWKSQLYDDFCTVVDRWFKHPTQLQENIRTDTWGRKRNCTNRSDMGSACPERNPEPWRMRCTENKELPRRDSWGKFWKDWCTTNELPENTKSEQGLVISDCATDVK